MEERWQITRRSSFEHMFECVVHLVRPSRTVWVALSTRVGGRSANAISATQARHGNRLDELDTKVDAVDNKVDAVDKKLDAVDKKLDTVIGMIRGGSPPTT